MNHALQCQTSGVIEESPTVKIKRRRQPVPLVLSPQYRKGKFRTGTLHVIRSEPHAA